MPWIDERGRLFGRVNLIDALVVAGAIGLLSLAYGAYVLFRTPTPTVASVQPREVVEKQAVNIQIAGENLRPYLRARFGKVESAGFLVQNPRQAEVKVPASLPPGTYDLIISDEFLDLLTVPGALRVTPEPTPAPNRAVAMVRVRFIASGEVADLMKAGDIDTPDPKSADRRHATLTAVESMEPVTAVVAFEAVAGRREINQTWVTFMGRVRTPVVESPSGWVYRGRPVKAGAAFVFETRTAIVEGLVVSVAAAAEATETAAR